MAAVKSLGRFPARLVFHSLGRPARSVVLESRVGDPIDARPVDHFHIIDQAFALQQHLQLSAATSPLSIRPVRVTSVQPALALSLLSAQLEARRPSFRGSIRSRLLPPPVGPFRPAPAGRVTRPLDGNLDRRLYPGSRLAFVDDDRRSGLARTSVHRRSGKLSAKIAHQVAPG